MITNTNVIMTLARPSLHLPSNPDVQSNPVLSCSTIVCEPVTRRSNMVLYRLLQSCVVS